MKGLDLSREYYKQCIKPVIEELSEIKQRYAAALIGWGSDVLYNDDEFSLTDNQSLSFVGL